MILHTVHTIRSCTYIQICILALLIAYYIYNCPFPYRSPSGPSIGLRPKITSQPSSITTVHFHTGAPAAQASVSLASGSDSIPSRGENLFNHTDGVIAHSLSLSPFLWLKYDGNGCKPSNCPSIHMFSPLAQRDMFSPLAQCD